MKPHSQTKDDRARDEQVVQTLRRLGPSTIEDLQRALYPATRERWRCRMAGLVDKGIVRRKGDAFEAA